MAENIKAIHLEEIAGGKITILKATGKIATEDYEFFVPEIERLMKQHGKIRILLELHDFHGWTAGALWEDLKFDVKHFNDIERLAIVGDKKWQKGMSVFCKPFTTAKIRYFDMSQAGEARKWIEADTPYDGAQPG